MAMEQQILDKYAERLCARIDALRHDDGFRTFADAMPGIIWTADGTGRTTFINRRWYDVFGTPDWLSILHPDDYDATVAAWTTAVTTGKPYHHTARYRDVDGTWQFLVTRAHLVYAATGSLAYWLGTSSVLDALAVSLLRAA